MFRLQDIPMTHIPLDKVSAGAPEATQLRKDIQEEEKKLEQLNIKWTDDGNAERLRRFISLVRSWESSSACTPRYLPPNHGGH